MSPRPADRPYPDVDPQPRFPELEAEVLAYWKERDAFRRSVEARPAGERGENEYVFYDGPPFANGLPHYGHLLTSYVKDVVPRYETMRGRRVERRFGWDCHGLPAEMEVEKELGISGRAAITEYGIEKFNAQCRRSVMRYTGEWESYVTRMARWVDFENDYKTMDLSYMESVMWAFKQLRDKGLVYESRRVMPYSWAAETPLSNFEIRLDDAYRPRQDPAITVALALRPEHVEDGGPTHLLVWTTTPWTLPSNLAVAVGPEIDYAIVEKDGRRYAIGAATLAKYDKVLGDARRVGTLKGSKLAGMRYEPLFPYFADQDNAFTVLAEDFVDTEEGTGLVHMAPGFGEEDQKACEAAGIDLVVPVDEKGRFTSEVTDFAGQNVLAANSDIIKRLKRDGALLEHVTYEHSYPHCWRTDQPIIYTAINSWYVEVTKFKERMVELNRNIRWVPERIKDGQFGKWLENARDWSISRNRFWGSPIPVWKSDDPAYPRVDVYGSLDELERDFGVRPTDLHRPFIDELTRPNPDDPTGRSTMRRVPEVLDCWFESGSMPYAQVHYPFENKQWFEDHFPADFIVEYVGQTRGWFYTMMVLATALFDRHPFDNCVCHGVLLDEKGRKLSKRLQNYPDPVRVFDTHGADAMRWYLVSSSCLRGNDLRIDKQGKGIAEVARQVLSPIWNAYYFFTLYANADGLQAAFRTDARGLLDRYVLAKTRELVEGVQAAMDAYDLMGACSTVLAYLEALNNWYIRRSRHRFWREEKDADKQDAYDTLYAALTTLCRAAAPLLPFVTENVYRGLTGEESVHLTDWPDAGALPADHELVVRMDRVREACSAGLSLRETHRLRTRLPLRSVTVAGAGADALEPYAHLLQDELNVKEVRFSGDVEAFGTFRLQVNAPVVGPKLGPDMKKVMAASRQGDWKTLDDGRVEAGGFVLEEGEFSLGLQPKEGVAAAALSTNDAVVVLDTRVTPELEREGMARDFVRLVQQARKDAGLRVTDRIALTVQADGQVQSALEEWRGYVAEQVLAADFRFGEPEAGLKTGEGSIAAGRIRYGLRKSP